MSTKKSTEYPGWYEIPGYSGYCANRQGEILTKKTGNHTKGGNAGRYLKVSVYKDGSDTPSLQHVHDLVCRAFHGLGQPGQVVLHDDDDRRNNTPDNLMWGSQSDNIKATYANGLRQPTYGKRVSTEGYRTSPPDEDPALYHLSFRDDLAGTWQPQLPAGSELPSGKYPEPNIPRISMAPSIVGCFRAIYPNIADLFEKKNYPYLIFHVYIPVYKGNERVVTAQTIISEQLVWDAHITTEYWLLDPVPMRKVAKIKVFNTNRSYTLLTHPFNDKTLPKQSVGPRDIHWQLIGESKVALEYYADDNCPSPIYIDW